MGYNFDIFNDDGIVESDGYLTINSTRIMQYIDPVAFIDVKVPGQKSVHFGARFKDCNASEPLRMDD
tara:strand:+ start:363 stop:563 length:201 start_codon:yes stop_codon:yes gene_type:complete